ncbi:MAG: hypothetical protein ACLFVO_29030 [Chloroflexaceae bacterium]
MLAGRLGAEWLTISGRTWLPGNETPINSPECRFFPQTGYNVCGWILGYWERNGGLERFGYPITSGVEARPDRADYQLFESGVLLVYLHEPGYVYTFGNPGRPGKIRFFQ